MLQSKIYTPEQVAEILQSFIFTGLDKDILDLQEKDEKNLKKTAKIIKSVRQKTWQKIGTN